MDRTEPGQRTVEGCTLDPKLGRSLEGGLGRSTCTVLFAMTTIVTWQASHQLRDPAIPPASLRDISEQRRLSEAQDKDVINDNDNGNTLEDSQPSHKGKERADPPSGGPSNLPQDTNNPRNFGGDPRDNDPDSLMMMMIRTIPRVPLPFLVPPTCSLNFLPHSLDPPQPSPRLGYASLKFMMAWIKPSYAHFSCNAILTSVTTPALSTLVLQRSSMPFPTCLAPRSNILSLPSSTRSRPSPSGFRIGMPSRESFRWTSARTIMQPKPRLSWRRLLWRSIIRQLGSSLLSAELLPGPSGTTLLSGILHIKVWPNISRMNYYIFLGTKPWLSFVTSPWR